MRNTAILVAALSVTPLFADVHAVLPGCCTSILWSMSVVDSATGRVQNEFTSPAVPGYGYATGLTITKSGTQAAVLENLYCCNEPQSIAVELMNLDTGKIAGSVTTLWALGSSIVTDPDSGMLYVAYLGTENGPAFQLQKIDPAALSVVLNVGTSCEGNVIPAGRVIFCTTNSGIAVLDTATLTQIGGEAASGQINSLALSPDRSTLYAWPYSSPDEVDIIDTATLDITQTFSLGTQIWGMALSPDGSVLYLGTSSSLDMLNTSTLGLTSAPAPGGAPIGPVSPSGTLYWVSGTDVMEFEPSIGTVETAFPAQSGGLTLDPVTGQICFLTGTSMVAVTGPVPSEKIAFTAPTNYPGTGAYDAADNLLLLPSSGSVAIMDPETLQTRGYIDLPNAISYVVFSGGYGYGFLQPHSEHGLGTGVIQFDPVSMQVTATVKIPLPDGDNTGIIAQPAIFGTNVYVPTTLYHQPYSRSGTPLQNGILVVDTQTMTVANHFPIPGRRVHGFAVSPDGTTGYLALETFVDGDALEKLDLATGAVFGKVPIAAGSLVISPDGTTLFTVLSGGLTAIRTSDLTVTRSAPELSPSAFNITPDGQYLYASVGGGVDIVSTATLTVTGTIASAGGVSTPVFVEY